MARGEHVGHCFRLDALGVLAFSMVAKKQSVLVVALSVPKTPPYVDLSHALLEFSLSSRCRVVTFYTSTAAWSRLPAADFLKMISNGMTASIAIIKSL
jgi:hypothetical protein